MDIIELFQKLFWSQDYNNLNWEYLKYNWQYTRMKVL